MIEKHHWYEFPRPKPDAARTVGEHRLLAVALFWSMGGVWWKDEKGYHARCGSLNKEALMLLARLMGTGKVSYRPLAKARGFWQWTAQKKSAVEWLDASVRSYFLPPLPEPDRSICRHCGVEDGYHEQECHLAPGG